MWLWNKFTLFWVLKYRKEPKALELWYKLDKWHRQTRRNIVKKANEDIKLQEMLKNKNRFISDTKEYLSDDDKKLRILNQKETSIWNLVIVGLVYDSMDGKRKTWWTTAVYDWITPWLYEDIIRTYPKTI